MKKVTFEMNMTGAEVLNVINAIDTKTVSEISDRNYRCRELLRIQTTSTFEFTPDMLATLVDYNIASVKLQAMTISIFNPDAKIPTNPSIDDVRERRLDLLVKPFIIDDNGKKINQRTTRRERTIWSNTHECKLNVTVKTFDQAWRYLTNHKVVRIYNENVKQSLPVIREIAANHMQVVNDFNLKASLAILADRA